MKIAEHFHFKASTQNHTDIHTYYIDTHIEIHIPNRISVEMTSFQQHLPPPHPYWLCDFISHAWHVSACHVIVWHTKGTRLSTCRVARARACTHSFIRIGSAIELSLWIKSKHPSWLIHLFYPTSHSPAFLSLPLSFSLSRSLYLSFPFSRFLFLCCLLWLYFHLPPRSHRNIRQIVSIFMHAVDTSSQRIKI